MKSEIDSRKKRVHCEGLGSRGNGEVILKGYEVSLMQDSGDLLQSLVLIANNTVYLKFAKRVDLMLRALTTHTQKLQ